jgi:DNA mismatch repair ATPase MutS
MVETLVSSNCSRLKGMFRCLYLCRLTGKSASAGKAVLECLGANAQVLATTHDVELQHLLERNFVTFHFVEDPDLPEIFDYRLHPGISTTKNAIKLLEKVGFPAAIIREARRLVDASQSTAGMHC